MGCRESPGAAAPAAGPQRPGARRQAPPRSSGEGAAGAVPRLSARRACALSAAPPLGSARTALGYFRLFVLNSGPSLLILYPLPLGGLLVCLFIILVVWGRVGLFGVFFFWQGRARGTVGSLCL